MARFVIGPDVGVRLATGRATIPDVHSLLAPTPWQASWRAPVTDLLGTGR